MALHTRILTGPSLERPLLHAAVLIEAADRPGLERLLRYCARPAFASERLSWDGSHRPVRYRLTKPSPIGDTEFTLAPLDLLDWLDALIRWPRRHRHHCAGVFAAHAALRAGITAGAGQPVAQTATETVPAADPTSLHPPAAAPRFTGPGCSHGSSRPVRSAARAATARCA